MDFDGYLNAWNAHDVDAILGYFVEDCIYEDVTLSRINRGKAELKAFVDEMFAAFPDFRLDVKDEIVAADGRYATEWTMSGTHEGDLPILPATHKPFSVRGASIGELEGERIERNSDYWNVGEFLAQISGAPPG